MVNRKAILVLVIACLALALLAPVGAMAPTEAPPVLAARDLVPAELLAGPDFTVDDSVPTDGFYGIFTVRGAYGSVEARGSAMLRVRTAEMRALARLEEISRREAVVSGARDSAQQTVQAASQAIHDPVGTVEGAPEGIGRLFSGVGSKLEKRVGGLTGSGTSSASTGQREGIARARRALAQELGVDPYTDNPLLSAKLDQVAKWKSEGGLAVNIATGGASLWAGIATKTAKLVWAMPPEEVRKANEKRLASLTPGASSEDIRMVLDNPAFTPTTQTLVVDAIESLRVSGGRNRLVNLAGEMGNQDQTRYLIAATGLLVAYHESVAPLSSVESRGWLAVGITSAGSLILPVPVDCLAWTDRLAEFGGRPDFGSARREILITGSATSRTRQELSARGWTLREGFQSPLVFPMNP